jgi:hypothetical protein
MQRAVEKLTGEPLSVDQLFEYLPSLKEVARTQLENWAKDAAVLHRYRNGEIVCEKQIRAISAPNCLRPLVFTLARMMRRSEWIPVGFSAAELKHKRCCSGRLSRGRFAQRRILLTNTRDAQLEQSNSPQPLHAEVGSSMDHRIGTAPEITISRYANF